MHPKTSRQRAWPLHWRRRRKKATSTNCAGRAARDDETYTLELSDKWTQFFDALGTAGFADLNRRTETLQRQIRDNGVSYNVYADASGPQRPWELDLFPLIVAPESWRQIEAGVLQRVRVLDRVMADVYGPRELLKAGLLPPALVRGHPGYLRAMHGVVPVGGTYLHIAAFDLARGPTATGGWCRSARRRPRAWVTCWRTGCRSRACSPRPSRPCTCSAWPPPTAR
jgi:uncharacterized circularly permuted ATP-grasp superfamily protein